MPEPVPAPPVPPPDLERLADETADGIRASWPRKRRPLRAEPAGSVAIGVSRGGEPAYGFARGRVGVDQRSVFDVGSLAKPITATLLAAFVVDGVVSLDASLAEVLGPDAGRCGDVTLEQLATHTSGLPRLPPSIRPWRALTLDPYRHYTRGHLVRDLADLELAEPGGFEYSNLGFEVLAVALEAIGGASIASLLEDRVFGPLEMVDASASPTDRRLPGYWRVQRVRQWKGPLVGAGGIEASIRDVLRFGAACADPASTDLADAITLASTPRAALPRPRDGGGSDGDGEGAPTDPLRIGLAWLVTPSGVRWHNGGTFGTSSVVLADPGAGVASAALANRGFGAGLDLPARRLLDLAAGRPPSVPE